MARYITIVLFLLLPLAHAGEEFMTPALRPGSGFDSADPKYRAVGIEDVDGIHRLYVVADLSDLLAQGRVNRIIRDARRRAPDLTEILFYLSVRKEPAYPAFAIYDGVALYLRKDNKTYFGVAAKELYGGWAHGPRE